MRTDESHKESSKDWVDSNDTSKECRGKYHEHSESHHRLSRAIGICEAQDAAHDRGTEHYSTNDFGNDSWLSNLGQRQVGEASENDDDSSLN